jgi:Tol biopolymer transport system component
VFGADSQPTQGFYAMPFSLETLEPTGEVFPISQVGRRPSISNDGTLAYTVQVAQLTNSLVWRDRGGEVLETVSPPGPLIGQPAISPDGARVALASSENGTIDVWIYDLARDSKTQLTFGEEEEGMPTWAPSGREIAYWQDGEAGGRLMTKPADGTGEATVLIDPSYSASAPRWSPDGQLSLLYLFQRRNWIQHPLHQAQARSRRILGGDLS